MREVRGREVASKAASWPIHALLGVLLASATAAEVWNEVGDARSFPDGAAQVTRGEGPLDSIAGATGPGDPRDAYCLKIVDPAAFLATTDPDTDPAAAADFDTRLFLFRTDGAAWLANDDTPPSGPPFLSTLTGVATDGTGYVLSRPGEYVLVVAGSPDDPEDLLDADLFALDSDPGAVHFASPAAAAWEHWEVGTPETGSYTVALAGVEPCQNRPDLVFANGSSGALPPDPERNRRCLDHDGGFSCSDVSGDLYDSRAVALGFVDGDANLDALVANNFYASSTENRVCLGNGNGNFSCSDVGGAANFGNDVALGFVDAVDEFLDAVFLGTGTDGSLACRGDGDGGFTCIPLNPGGGSVSGYGVALGFLDGDRFLDALIANVAPTGSSLCRGFTGDGTFTCGQIPPFDLYFVDVAVGLLDGNGIPDAIFAATGKNRVCLDIGFNPVAVCADVSSDTNDSIAVALGFIDGDEHLDAVFANRFQSNRVCFGDGAGGFTTCSDISPDMNDTLEVVLALVNEDANLDAVFSNALSPNRVCYGDGSGSFSCSDVEAEGNRTHGAAVGDFGTGDVFADGFESGDTSAWSSTVP